MRRVIVPSLILSLVAPVAALESQTPPPASTATQPTLPSTPSGVAQTVGLSDAEIADLNRRIRRFQSAIQAAVENGGSRLADRAKQFVQIVSLAMNGAPEINPVYIPSVGYHFDVQVPDILGSALELFAYYRKRDPVGQTPPQTGDRVTSNTVVKPDAMSAPAASFDPNSEYATFVRQELIDTMLESSTVLLLKAEEQLIVSARVPAQADINPLAHHRRIVLQILGSDLIAYRQGQIDKEQAKERIREFRY